MPSRDDKHRPQRSDAAKQIILERRGRFVRLALAGAGLALAGSGCDGCEPQVCLEVEARDAGARSPRTDNGIPPGACLSVERVPDDPGVKATADPRPCLAPPVDPRPCLSPMAPRTDDKPDKSGEK